MAAFFPMLHLAFGPAVACAAAAAFLAQGKPKVGGADGALRQDHLVYGQLARGQPCDAKALGTQSSHFFASVLRAAS